MRKIPDNTLPRFPGYVYFSDLAYDPEEALETLVWYTCGTPLMARDFKGEEKDVIEFLSDHWDEAQDMTCTEEEAILAALAEAWSVEPEKLAYLI